MYGYMLYKLQKLPDGTTTPLYAQIYAWQITGFTPIANNASLLNSKNQANRVKRLYAKTANGITDRHNHQTLHITDMRL